MKKLTILEAEKIVYNVLKINNIEELSILSKSKIYAERMGVAKNPNSPIKILENLIKDKDQRVLKSLSSRSDIPAEFLVKLSKNKDDYVVAVVAKNKNTPIFVLNELLKNNYKAVRDNALNTLKELNYFN